MSLLTIPDAGLQLESSAKSSDYLPLQAFGLALSDSVIEDMIKCVQDGKQIELSLGNNPTFHYGSHEHRVNPTADSLDYDLYLTNTSETTTKAQRLPNTTMSILRNTPGFKVTKPHVHAASPSKGSGKKSDRSSRSGSSGPESGADEVLAVSHAREKARKSAKATKLVTAPLSGGKGSKKSRAGLLPPGRSAMATVMASNGTTRSMPSSPALNGAGSPSLNPVFEATQQQLEKNKETRSTVVHELAVKDQPFEYLASKWKGSEQDLKATLKKVADEIDDRWSMKKLFWKELDVWNYNYNTQEERRLAIDNAIRQYDKQRLSKSAPEWERLLKKEDRGKGIVLSKLQATLARGNITPAPKIPKAEDSSKNSSDESTKNVRGGEAMARSNSQPVSFKQKNKLGDREAQAKRLLSNNPKKPAPKKAPVSKVKAAEKSGKRILSEEFVHDSDSSEDDGSQSASTSQGKTGEISDAVARLLSEKPRQDKIKISPSPVPPKAKPKPVVRAPRPAHAKVPATKSTKDVPTTNQKRSREEEDSSSSSGQPLMSKRMKSKELPKPQLAQPTSVKHRTSDASQNSRGTVSSSSLSSTHSHRSKNTSPVKSSPLASSPPTNVSDFDENSQARHHSQHHTHASGLTNGNGLPAASKKRKERETETPQPTKRSRVSKDILVKAQRFDAFYKRYEALHFNLSAMANPPEDKLEDLLDMRSRLVKLKDEISREVAGMA